MISPFPDFIPLHPEQASDVSAVTTQFDPYADFTLVNLMSWGEGGGAEVSMLNGNLVARMPDYMTGNGEMYTMIGKEEVAASCAALLRLTNCIELVPEVTARELVDNHSFVVTEDRDNHDYVYDVASLALLAGKDFKRKRNNANGLERAFEGRLTTEINTAISPSLADELNVAFELWIAGAGKTEAESVAEQRAFDNLLVNKASLDLRTTVVRIDGRVTAFSVHELCTPNFAVCHFEKALPLHEGLYTYTIREAARDLELQGVTQVNWQQDLGIPGLRHAKMSYHPIGFLKKYTIAAAE